MTAYDAFLESKVLVPSAVGEVVGAGAILPGLFPFQRDVVLWALRRGRAAIFAECGLGKTPMQLAWAREVARLSGGPVLILTPLAVAPQTLGEARKFGVGAGIARTALAETDEQIVIANYERLDYFDPADFAGVVLDESSILKNYTGKTKQALLAAFAGMRWKLCCTATPAPNDHLELGNHAQFLDVMESNEMIARWFINDPMEAGKYRLKGHAADDFWRWVSSWAVCVEKPSDLGDYSDEGYALPELRIVEQVVEVDEKAHEGCGALFRDGRLSATTMHREMRLTADARAAAAAAFVAGVEGSCVVWCNTDYEADALGKAIPDAFGVRGSDRLAVKEERLVAFTTGELRVIITKPKIAGMGLNWQHCAHAVFVGLSYSYEQLYQAIRRIWRFGQLRDVTVLIIRAATEGAVMQSIREKQARHREMTTQMRAAARAAWQAERASSALVKVPVAAFAAGKAWRLVLGDCVEALALEPSNSIHLVVTSTPFSNLYIYSDALQDMGNSNDDAEFIRHLGFLMREVHRILVPGRIVALHCKDLPLYKGRDGSAGLRDFPGDLIRCMEAAGFTFHSRVTIWKCPVIEMQRTKNHGLLYKNLKADSSCSRQGMADYVLAFRKWDGLDEGTRSPEPVTHTEEEFPLDRWQAWASPVWSDIAQTNVLDYFDAREDKDERHICPLQLDVIERCVALWSNPGDLVLDPFSGIGSTGWQSVMMGRRYLGTELKAAYNAIAAKKLAQAERDLATPTLFDGEGGGASMLTAKFGKVTYGNIDLADNRTALRECLETYRAMWSDLPLRAFLIGVTDGGRWARFVALRLDDDRVAHLGGGACCTQCHGSGYWECGEDDCASNCDSCGGIGYIQCVSECRTGWVKA